MAAAAPRAPMPIASEFLVEALTPASFVQVEVRVASSRPSVSVAGHRLEVASVDRKTTDAGVSPYLQVTTLGANGSLTLSLYKDLGATYTFTVRSPNGLPVTVVSGATTRTLVHARCAPWSGDELGVSGGFTPAIHRWRRSRRPVRRLTS